MSEAEDPDKAVQPKHEKVHVEVHDFSDQISTQGDEIVTKRKRAMTQKGLQFTQELKKSRLEQLARGLEKNIVQIQLLMDTEHDDKATSKAYRGWTALYDEFLEVDEAYKQLLGEADLAVYLEDWFGERNETYQTFKDSMDQWCIRLDQRSRRQADIEIDQRSIASSRRSSRSSARSVASGRSSIVSARLEEEKKKAELAVRAENLKRRTEIEEMKLKLRMEEEEMKIKEELAISKAKCKTLDDLEEARSHVSVHKSFAPSYHDDALMSVVRSLKKPTQDITKFGGDPLEYHRFKRQFKTKILANCEDFDEMMNYLEQYTTGSANKIVVGYSYMRAEKGYKAAMKELDERFGDEDFVVSAFVKKALNWPVIKADNPKGLDEFSIFLAECEYAITDLHAIKVLEYSENFKKIVSKLPFQMHDKWRSLVLSMKENCKRPVFSDLVKFVKKESKKQNDPTWGREAMSADTNDTAKRNPAKTTRPKGSFATKFNEEKPSSASETMSSSTSSKQDVSRPNAFSSPCVYCQKSHPLSSCQDLAGLPYHDRTEFLKSKRLCFGCLRYGHQRYVCRNKATCRQCDGRHPSVLHAEGGIPQNEEAKPAESPSREVAASAQDIEPPDGENGTECTMAIIPVKVRVKNSSKFISTYAFLDPGSNVSFCTEKLMYETGTEGTRHKLRIEAMGMPFTMKTFKVNNLEVLDYNEETVVPLPLVYTKDKMPVSRHHIPTAEDLSRWSHLADIALPHIDAEIGLLIGNNVPDAYTPSDVRVGPKGTPHATKTSLGWIPWSVLRPDASSNVSVVNSAEAMVIQRHEDLQDLNKLYIESLNLDFPEKIIQDKKEPSMEDELFLQKMNESKQRVDGHYEFRLPLRDLSPNLPDNKAFVFQHLHSLKNKLLSNREFYEDYCAFMDTLLEKGYAEEVPSTDLQRSDGKVWYLPHHGVRDATKKLHIVFDCSEKYRGMCLCENVLLQGPDQTNNLIRVILRFREQRTAVMSDIDKMFYHRKVTPEDRDCLRFFWWPNENTQSEPKIYRMTVHLFGAVSSPSCASYALLQAIQEDGHKFKPEVSHKALNSFYVDDFLCSLSNEELAIDVIRDVTLMCQSGGFNLTKWVSSSKDVLGSVPVSSRATNLVNLDLDAFPVERALGVIWCLETDTLSYCIKPIPSEVTRRVILSSISSIYDPHGMIVPFVLPGRIQNLCRKGVHWDEKLELEDLDNWNNWITSLPEIKNIKIQRCVLPFNPSDLCNIQLHHFADASDLGYRTVTYVRFNTTHGEIHCSLLFGKSHVAPLKKISTPRMELTAATLAVKMNNLLQSELEYQIDDVFFWTDSLTVIRCLANQTTRYQTFVANRLAVIRDGSELSQWHFVQDKDNPADAASRGITVDNKSQARLWLHNPTDLQALTPNDLLRLGSGQRLSPGIFTSEDSYSRRRWRHVQFMAKLFCIRWSCEYLPLLQQRRKWVRRQCNVSVGDIVLLTVRSPRNTWPLGLIISVQNDAHNLVRKVTVKTNTGTFQRPIDKLCVVLEADNANE